MKKPRTLMPMMKTAKTPATIETILVSRERFGGVPESAGAGRNRLRRQAPLACRSCEPPVRTAGDLRARRLPRGYYSAPCGAKGIAGSAIFARGPRRPVASAFASQTAPASEVPRRDCPPNVVAATS